MQIKTINIYEYHELSEEAKEVARDWFIDSLDETDYHFSEIIDSLKKFCEVFCIDLNDYIFCDAYCSVGYKLDYNEIRDLRGLRLRTWLINNFYEYLYKDKFLGVVKGKFAYSNISKCNSCTLTGECYDHDLLHDMYLFIEDYNDDCDNWNIYDLIATCMNNFEHRVLESIRYTKSLEYAEEMIEANGYTFTEEGIREGI